MPWVHSVMVRQLTLSVLLLYRVLHDSVSIVLVLDGGLAYGTGSGEPPCVAASFPQKRSVGLMVGILAFFWGGVRMMASSSLVMGWGRLPWLCCVPRMVGSMVEMDWMRS